MNRLTVAEAAEALGITAEAVRMRVQRGSLRSEREAGRVYVLLDSGVTHDRSGPPDALYAEMRGRIEDLREQLAAERRANEENRRIIAALTQRIPEIEAPPDEAPAQGPPESPTTATDGVDRDTVPPEPQAGAQPRRSWWREFFGFGE